MCGKPKRFMMAKLVAVLSKMMTLTKPVSPT